MFGPLLWIALEAKSGCAADGVISVSDVHEAGTHLTYAASSTGTAAPDMSFAVIVSPQETVQPGGGARRQRPRVRQRRRR